MNTNKEYVQLIADLKRNIVQSRYIAARLANREQLLLYINTGKMPSEKIASQKWGANVLESISIDLQKQLPGLRGFSDRNLRKMRQFFETYTDSEIWPSHTYGRWQLAVFIGMDGLVLPQNCGLGFAGSYAENPVTQADAKIQKKKEIIAVLNKTYDYAINTLSHFAPAHLSDTVSFFAGQMNKLQIMNLLNDHQTHHRAQMLVYLRLSGIKPPDYVGW